MYSQIIFPHALEIIHFQKILYLANSMSEKFPSGSLNSLKQTAQTFSEQLLEAL
jgi:hypothetical protein